MGVHPPQLDLLQLIGQRRLRVLVLEVLLVRFRIGHLRLSKQDENVLDFRAHNSPKTHLAHCAHMHQRRLRRLLLIVTLLLLHLRLLLGVLLLRLNLLLTTRHSRSFAYYNNDRFMFNSRTSRS